MKYINKVNKTCINNLMHEFVYILGRLVRN